MAVNRICFGLMARENQLFGNIMRELCVFSDIFKQTIQSQGPPLSFFWGFESNLRVLVSRSSLLTFQGELLTFPLLVCTGLEVIHQLLGKMRNEPIIKIVVSNIHIQHILFSFVYEHNVVEFRVIPQK